MRFGIIFTTILIMPALGFSATITVPIDYSTIQGAINAAQPGDIVHVLPGTYVENIDFLGKAITVKSDGGAEVTVIDGGIPLDPDYGSTAIFFRGEGQDSVLEGFTLTNGSGTYHSSSGFYFGGGIYCDASSPTISNNRVSGNSADYCGGIYCKNDSCPLVIGNTIAGNSATIGAAGGLQIKDSSPLITNNKISENSAYFGGGIHVGESEPASRSYAVISYNTISNNISSTYGGGIYCYQSSAKISSNLVIQNHADTGSGGIHVTMDGNPVITNNIISGNTVLNKTGGGIGFANYSSAIVTNNTIAGNTAKIGGGIYCGESSSPVITNTIVWDNIAPDGPGIFVYKASPTITFCDMQDGWYGTGNICEDPCFQDPFSNDYHLTCVSPCLDAGDNNALMLPAKDFDHDPRKFPGNGKGGLVGMQPQGANVDMGADEYCCMKRSVFVAR
ncbi:MAG: right-handed parallel beta-helix repeat-containing protein [Planctomycetota bacterium]|jgi:hypothetical protein